MNVPIACPCPGSPHESDTVTLRDKLDLHDGIAVQRLIIEANAATDRLSTAELSGILAEGYLLYGVESWTLVDASGKPVPVTRDTIRDRLLSDFSLSAPIADVADDLYMAPVILPLVNPAPTSSPSTPTNGSMSAPRSGTSKRPKPSKRSSTTTSPMADTEETSAPLAGVSSS